MLLILKYLEPIKYVRNNWDAPKSQEMLMALFKKWQGDTPKAIVKKMPKIEL